MSLQITVVGTPAPKGSPRIVQNKDGKKPFTVLKDSEKTDFWHELVIVAARRAVGRRVLPVFAKQTLVVTADFRFRRLAGHFGKNGLKPGAPKYKDTSPDLDKLIRATMDPLEGIVFDNDSRIARIFAQKRYVNPGEDEGATILVEELPANERLIARIDIVRAEARDVN